MIGLESPWLTRRQVAEHFAVSPKTVQRWQREGLPFERWGSRLVRYRLDRVERWLKTRTR